MIMTSKGKIQSISDMQSKTKRVAPHPSEAKNRILKGLLSTKISPTVHENSIKMIQELNKDTIDKLKLQKLAFTGISDEVKGLRPIIWRVILNFLPPETKQWEATVESAK
mmetsp:Transcript_26378/g.19782  ORF Transcript_26378/g.19782 Transcript_26378/m.19782 type:complete len:110 (-) Transcript_26378:1042-1371(-)